jgi:iron complex transport system substrate-binding protein
MPRIVSLIASATEIVCALGFEDDLVGRSHECDFPESVKRLPCCTSPKFDVHGSSGDIDRRVKDTLHDATSVYHVDAERLRELKPDVVVTQSQCEVCAVSLKDVEAAVCDWGDSRPKIVTLMPNCLDDVWQDIRRVANALSVPERGDELVRQLQRRMAELQLLTTIFKQATPRVACIEWVDPLMTAGNWVPELVEKALGTNLFGEAGKHAPWMTWEQLVASDPDVMVLMPCGFDLARTRQDLPLMQSRPEWPRLKAVQQHRVFVTDGNQYFNRPGPRLVESLEILTEILHPHLTKFKYEGTGWERV